MNNEELVKENQLLKAEIEIIKKELIETKEHLKKYTAPSYKKKYYENNKEKILEKIKLNPPTPEKRKEYNRQSYLRRKEKEKNTIDKNENI